MEQPSSGYFNSYQYIMERGLLGDRVSYTVHVSMKFDKNSIEGILIAVMNISTKKTFFLRPDDITSKTSKELGVNRDIIKRIVDEAVGDFYCGNRGAAFNL